MVEARGELHTTFQSFKLFFYYNHLNSPKPTQTHALVSTKRQRMEKPLDQLWIGSGRGLGKFL